MYNEDLLLAILMASNNTSDPHKDLLKRALLGNFHDMKTVSGVLAAIAEDDDLFNTLAAAHTRLKLDKMNKVRKLKNEK